MKFSESTAVLEAVGVTVCFVLVFLLRQILLIVICLRSFFILAAPWRLSFQINFKAKESRVEKSLFFGGLNSPGKMSVFVSGSQKFAASVFLQLHFLICVTSTCFRLN